MVRTLALALALLACTTAASARQLQQTTSVAGTPVAQPAGTAIKFTWHAVGTQNYSSLSSTQYGNNQGFARLFKGQTNALISIHYFNSQGQPVFNQIDPSTFATTGFVVCSNIGSLNVPKTPSDGGFGSVPALLQTVVSSGGTLSDVTYVQRLNTVGGVLPTGLFTLPGFTDVGNAQLAIPYQADYIFLTGGSSSAAGK